MNFKRKNLDIIKNRFFFKNNKKKISDKFLDSFIFYTIR